MNSLVSVIVPCHDYERWLPDCIESLRRNDYEPLEVIVIHDGCVPRWVPTNNREITIASNATFIIEYLDVNRGVAHARNEGFDMCTGKYVWFLDSDDMALPHGIAARVSYLEKHPAVSMVWGNARKINVERDNWTWGYQRCVENLGKLERYSRPMNAQTLLWRREVFEKFGLYYEGLKSKEDKELLYRLGGHPGSPLYSQIKVGHVDADVAVYRRHPGAKHKRRVADKQWFDDTERIFDERMQQLRHEGITATNTRFPKCQH